MNKNRIYPTSFVFGALLLYTVLFVLPSVMGLGYSFTDWSVYSQEIHFIGWKNFATVFSADYNYMHMLKNTIRFTVVTTLAKNVIGLALAVLMTKKVKLLNFHRAVIYLPCILSALIVGMIFKSVLNPKIGLLNTFLRKVGLKFLASNWLTDSKIAFRSVTAVDIWKGMGYIMTILIAGIMSIPPVYYDAASIDGGSPWQCFRHITLPLLAPTLTVTTVLNVIYGLKVFDTVYALTNGGPGFATEVLYTGVYKEFGLGRYAVGTALSTIMTLVMLVVGYFMIKHMVKGDGQEI